MNSDLLRRWGPWALILAVLVPVVNFVGPRVLEALTNLTNIAFAAIGLGILVYCLPVLALLIRNLVWRARKEVIHAMPIETLETSLQEFKNGITQLETRIAQADTELKGLQHLDPKDRELLDEEDMKAWNEQLQELAAMNKELVIERDNQWETYKTLERNVKKAKLMQRLGQGYQAVLRTLTAGTDGQGASDMNEAFGHIQRQMHEAQSRIQLVLSRPKEARRKQQVEATEISPRALPPGKEEEPFPTVQQQDGVFVRKPTTKR